ncbi:minor capsid protein [Paenibacillus periandrae]|uniref:phage head morphogenesis protein n=1 Tax=Paenibacillus periandrae TaxID=1761741 RepID=UPI001F092635|nr:minor capsid protein [Paenibacillus periandrae]
MARRMIIPPTRFPNAVAASYSRAMAQMIQQMHSITYAALLKSIAEEVRIYQNESYRADGPLDIIWNALKFAKDRVAAQIFNPAKVVEVASQFVSRVNFFNKRMVNNQFDGRVRGFDPTEREPWINDYMKVSVKENVSYITKLQDDYAARVESIVMQGVKNGQKLTDMAQEISKAANISYQRAKFIARDQTGSITGQLTAKRHQDAGFKRFKWSTSHDERVRPEHRGYDGKIYPYDQPPAGKLPGVPFNCRCVAYPVDDEE